MSERDPCPRARPDPSHRAQPLPWHRDGQPSWEAVWRPGIPVGPSAGHLGQPAQTPVKTPPSPALPQGSKPLWQVGFPPVSLSLTLPDGKEFPDLERHTVPPRALRTRDTHTHIPVLGYKKHLRLPRTPGPLGKEKMPQKILPENYRHGRQGKAANPAGWEAARMGCSRKLARPAAPKGVG